MSELNNLLLCLCRELFNNVACEAIFSDAGALQLVIDLHALLGLFGRYTPRPAAHFRELGDAVKLLNLQQQQAEFVKQVGGCTVLSRGWVVFTAEAGKRWRQLRVWEKQKDSR